MSPMFYFLVALTAVLAATANAGGPVLDVDGDPIFGGSYYVLPFIWGPTGGGLTLVSLRGNTCPLYIGQERSEVENGIPVKFSNWRSRVGFVPESENLNINMDAEATICLQSPFWWVYLDALSRTRFIAAGPKPEQDSTRSFFQIKKTGGVLNSYKIAFCPNDNCEDVGVFVDKHGVRRLALSSIATPFQVVFVKANETETSSKVMSII